MLLFLYLFENSFNCGLPYLLLVAPSAPENKHLTAVSLYRLVICLLVNRVLQ